jgi:hypothetical protein
MPSPLELYELMMDLLVKIGRIREMNPHSGSGDATIVVRARKGSFSSSRESFLPHPKYDG